MCNSSSLKSSDIVILASLRGATGLLCAAINAVLLMTISFRLEKSKSIQRLLVYLTTSSLLVLITNIFQSESVACWNPSHTPVCKFIGVVNQLTSWVFMLVVLWIVSVIALHYWCQNHRKVLTPRKDALILLGIIGSSLVTAVIPLATDGYGMNQAWCWIKTSRLLEQWVLWYGWVTVCTVIVLTMLGITLCYSENRMQLYYESSRGLNNCREKIRKEEVRKIKILIICISSYLIVIIVVSILNQIHGIKSTIPLLVTIALIEPLSVLVIPIVFVTHLHSAKKPSLEDIKGAEGLDNEEESSSVSVNDIPTEKRKKDHNYYKCFHKDITASLLTETVKSDI